jgi:hypothetical protein
VRELDFYEYDDVRAGELLRPLDPSEHNMERLNRVGRGAGGVYQTALVRGPLSRPALEAAVQALVRHPVLAVRVARGPDGALGFAATGGAPPLTWVEVDEPSSAWPRQVEADMNAGPVGSHRGTSFRVFVLSAGDEHAITLAAPHHVWDGVSSVALMRELLEQLARPRTLPAGALRAVESPFVLPCSAPQRTRLDALGFEVRAWAEAEPRRRDEGRGALLEALEALETELLASNEGPALPEALLELQRLLAEVERSKLDTQPIVADEQPGAPPERARRVSTGLCVDVIGAEVLPPLVVAARQRGITLHGVFGCAFLFAHVARAWALTGVPDGPRAFPLASPVNLRAAFHPPLADDDVRMAVDVALPIVSVEPKSQFWDVAARFSASVTREVARRRVLGSWFRTERRPMGLPLAGVPLPLISNVGRVALSPRYGNLELVALHACMATHSMFQLCLLVQTLGDVTNLSFYHELPTISRESMRRVSLVTRTLLERVAAGGHPSVADALGV